MALLTLVEAKESLNITTTTFDAELQDYIDGATAAVEFICGPAESQEFTEVVEVSANKIPLTRTPVLSVESVTGDLFGTRDVTDFHLDAVAGVLTVKPTVSRLRSDYYTVAYTIGRSAIPAAMKQAAKIILKHQWATQRGPSGRRQSNPDSAPGSTNRTMVPGLGYALPNAALQMLAPYDRGPAVG